MNKSGTKKENKFAKFFRAIKSELKKIVWPTWKQVIQNTLIVLIVVIIISLIIAGLDLLFNGVLLKLITK